MSARNSRVGSCRKGNRWAAMCASFGEVQDKKGAIQGCPLPCFPAWPVPCCHAGGMHLPEPQAQLTAIHHNSALKTNPGIYGQHLKQHRFICKIPRYGRGGCYLFKIMAGMWARLGAQLTCCPCSGKHGLLAFSFAVFLFLANIISASRSVQESGDVSWIP